MTAPERIWATADNGSDFYGVWDCAGFGDYGDRAEYYLAREGQPCSTDYFLDKVLMDTGLDKIGKLNRIVWWRCGNYAWAMEGYQ